MLKKPKKRGFTILELLVVIAIVSLLAILSIAYLKSSKDSGGNTGIQSSLVNARSQVEIYFLNQNRSYDGVCNDPTTGIFRHLQSAQRAYGGGAQSSYSDATASTYQTEQCHDSTVAYAAWVPLIESTLANPVGWCIDSLSAGKRVTAVLPANATVCP